MAEGEIMFSPAEKFEREASATREPKTDEGFNCMQVAKRDPRELMEFLEFCADKIHGGQSSQKNKPASKQE